MVSHQSVTAPPGVNVPMRAPLLLTTASRVLETQSGVVHSDSASMSAPALETTNVPVQKVEPVVPTVQLELLAKKNVWKAICEPSGETRILPIPPASWVRDERPDLRPVLLQADDAVRRDPQRLDRDDRAVVGLRRQLVGERGGAVERHLVGRHRRGRIGEVDVPVVLRPDEAGRAGGHGAQREGEQRSDCSQRDPLHGRERSRAGRAGT